MTLGSGEVFNTGVALGSDGATIYLGSGKATSHTLYAVTDSGTSGSLKWSMSVGGSSLKVSPAIGADGTIYVSSGDGNLYAITDAGVSGSLRTFFGGAGSVLVNVSAAAGYKALSMPAIGSDGTIYMNSDTDDNFYAYNGPVTATPTATATASPTATASKTATHCTRDRNRALQLRPRLRLQRVPPRRLQLQPRLRRQDCDAHGQRDRD